MTFSGGFMNKKGFTLIELLAVLILFGILIGILVSVVNKDLNYAKSFASDRQVSLIEESAKMYYLNYE
jgi:prepilin-type N-terminal cleavage/methylation domain-containing protein